MGYAHAPVHEALRRYHDVKETPYSPPGHLTSGVAAGMHVPDAADPQLRTVRVAIERD